MIITHFERCYLYYLYLLGKANRRSGRVNISFEERQKFQKYKEHFKFIAEYGIGSAAKAREMRTELRQDK